MVNWESDSVVCVYRADLAGWPEAADMTTAAYALLSAMGLRPGARQVLLKPNVVRGTTVDSGISVHPAFMDGIVKYLRDVGVTSVVVAEGGGREDTVDMASHFRLAGYTQWAAKAGVTLVDLNADDNVRIPIAGRIFRSMPIAKTVAKPDQYFINVAKLKTHNLAITTLSLKNLQGVVVPIQERHMCNAYFPRYDGDRGVDLPTGAVDSHERWANKICDIHLAVKPHLNIVDGIVGRDGTGFEHGRNHPCGLAIAGVNPVAVDTVASYLMGFPPENLTYLRVAGERGLGPNRLADIDLYVEREGSLEPCHDPSTLRVSPPFQVLLSQKFRYPSYENVPYGNPELIPPGFLPPVLSSRK